MSNKLINLVKDLGFKGDLDLLKDLDKDLEMGLFNILNYWNQYIKKVDNENEFLRNENVELRKRNERLLFDLDLLKGMTLGEENE